MSSSGRRQKREGNVTKYEPYTLVSPYFRWHATIKKFNDAEWNRARAGVCIGDVVYDFKNERTLYLGTVDEGGRREKSLLILNGSLHRNHHKSNMKSESLMFIDDEGVYNPATIGKDMRHYVPAIHAAFVFDPILDVEEDLGFKML